MKKAILLGTAALLLVTVIALGIAGCGGSTSATGNSNSSDGQVSEASLGVPIYPGAKKESASAERPFSSAPRFGGSFPGGGSFPNWRGQSSPNFNGQSAPSRSRLQPLATLWTPDASDKVASWYKDKLKGKSGYQDMSGPQGLAGGRTPATILSFKSGNTTKVVMIRQSTQSKGGTTITVRNATGGVAPQTNQVF